MAQGTIVKVAGPLIVAEHMADAIGAIYAGVRDNQFKQWFNLIMQKETTCKSP